MTPAGLLRAAARSIDGIHTQLAAHLALMEPDFARALVAWLDSAAEDAEQIGPDPHALALARALLGEVTP